MKTTMVPMVPVRLLLSAITDTASQALRPVQM